MQTKLGTNTAVLIVTISLKKNQEVNSYLGHKIISLSQKPEVFAGSLTQVVILTSIFGRCLI